MRQRVHCFAAGLVALSLAVTAGASAQSLTYFIEQSSGPNPRGFYDFDLATRSSTFRASVAIASGGANPRLFTLDVRPSDGTVFGAEPQSFTLNNLYTVDPDTGDLTVVGNPGSQAIYTSISFDPTSGVLYGEMIDPSIRRFLVTIDEADATFSLVGALPYTGFGSSAISFLPDGELVAMFGPSRSGTKTLYRIDKTTGAGVVIGSTSVFGRDSIIDFDYADGSLYATEFSGNLWRVDPATAQTSFAGSLVAFSGIGGVFSITTLRPTVDIKPGSEINPVNLTSRGVIPVAILSSESFDATDVDSTTLAFGPAGAAATHKVGGHLEDVDDDGRVDLVSHYRTQETGIGIGDKDACITGATLSGQPFSGCDRITIACGLGFEQVVVVPPIMWARWRRRRRMPVALSN